VHLYYESENHVPNMGALYRRGPGSKPQKGRKLDNEKVKLKSLMRYALQYIERGMYDLFRNG
jgi:hypothetical protein